MKFGLSTGAGYALAAILVTAVLGRTPEQWGGVFLPLLISAEIVGGALAGLIVGLTASSVRHPLGAMIVLPLAIYPVLFMTHGLVEGFSRFQAAITVVVAVVLGVPLGLKWWADYFRHW